MDGVLSLLITFRRLPLHPTSDAQCFSESAPINKMKMSLESPFESLFYANVATEYDLFEFY